MYGHVWLKNYRHLIFISCQSFSQSHLKGQHSSLNVSNSAQGKKTSCTGTGESSVSRKDCSKAWRFLQTPLGGHILLCIRSAHLDSARTRHLHLKLAFSHQKINLSSVRPGLLCLTPVRKYIYKNGLFKEKVSIYINKHQDYKSIELIPSLLPTCLPLLSKMNLYKQEYGTSLT